MQKPDADTAPTGGSLVPKGNPTEKELKKLEKKLRKEERRAKRKRGEAEEDQQVNESESLGIDHQSPHDSVDDYKPPLPPSAPVAKKSKRESSDIKGMSSSNTLNPAHSSHSNTKHKVSKRHIPSKAPLSVGSASPERWNFEVDYNDHFETPKQAYIDLLPWLDSICTQLHKNRGELQIYDPYYCQGKMKEYLGELGFTQVINENRDFYEDVRRSKVPKYDVLVTNPPYSGEHKTKLLQFLQQSQTKKNSQEIQPFALLLPLYTITKSYWRDYLQAVGSSSQSLYILPPDYYEYCHPEGTGKDLPPFYSSWILGGMSDVVKKNSMQQYKLSPRRASSGGLPLGVKRLPFQSLMTVDKVEMIVSLGLVVEKRPNPKQRKKLQQKLSNK